MYVKQHNSWENKKDINAKSSSTSVLYAIMPADEMVSNNCCCAGTSKEMQGGAERYQRCCGQRLLADSIQEMSATTTYAADQSIECRSRLAANPLQKLPTAAGQFYRPSSSTSIAALMACCWSLPYLSEQDFLRRWRRIHSSSQHLAERGTIYACCAPLSPTCLDRLRGRALKQSILSRPCSSANCRSISDLFYQCNRLQFPTLK